MKVSQLWLVYNLWMIFLREQLCSILLNFVQFPAANFVRKSSFEINYVSLRMTIPGYIGTEVFHSLCDFLPFVYTRCLVWTLSLKCNWSCILNRHPWFYSFHMAIWLWQVQSWTWVNPQPWAVLSNIIILINLKRGQCCHSPHHSDHPEPSSFPSTSSPFWSTWSWSSHVSTYTIDSLALREVLK